MVLKLKWALLAGIAATALLAPTQFAQAQNTKTQTQKSGTVTRDDYDKLLDRIEKLEDKQGDQRSRLSTLEQSSKDVSWTFANARPTVTSGDGRFSMSIRARFQTDFASYLQKRTFNAQTPAAVRDLNTGTYIRRAYFGVEGLAAKDFWYELRYNLGGAPSEGAGLNLARVAYFGIPNFRVNIGVIQPVFTYGDTVSSGGLALLERPEIINIAAGTFGGSDSRVGAELTFQKTGVLSGGDNFFISAAYTGKATGGNNTGDERTAILGRAGYRIWSDGTSNIQIGGSGARLLSAGGNVTTLSLSDRPQVRADGATLVSTGNLTSNSASMWGGDVAANWKNFYVAGEYHRYMLENTTVGQPDFEFDGWYVEGSWMLTGEAKPYSASSRGNEVGSWGNPRVVRPFSLSGRSWGAWELVGRYSQVDLNFREGVAGSATPAGGVRGGEQNIGTVGVNWYMNNNVKMIVQGSMVDVDRLATTAPFGEAGQKLKIIGARLQFTN